MSVGALGLTLLGCSSVSPAADLNPADGAVEANAGDGGPPPFDLYDGASGCDGGVHVGSSSCEIAMTVDGALVATLETEAAYGCVWSGGGNFGVQVNGPDETAQTVIRIEPTRPIKAGVVAKNVPAVVELQAIAPDGGSSIWLTPPSCSIELSSNACAQDSPEPNLYVVSGTGTCPQAAQPYGTEAGAPVTIGDFHFALEFVP